jgi:hypothetical protein
LYGKDELVNLVHTWALGQMASAVPSKIVHYDEGNPFVEGWVICGCPEFFISLHKFFNWDNCGVMHDHPHDSMSLCLEGPMTERYQIGNGPIQERVINAGDMIFRPHNFRHLLPYKEGEKGLTLFVHGPIFEKAYFYCPEGRISYDKFVELGNQCLSTFTASKLLGLLGFGTKSGPTSQSN